MTVKATAHSEPRGSHWPLQRTSFQPSAEQNSRQAVGLRHSDSAFAHTLISLSELGPIET